MAGRLFNDKEIEELKSRLLQRVNSEIMEPLPNTRFLDVAAKLIDSLARAIKGGEEQSGIWQRAKELLEEEED